MQSLAFNSGSILCPVYYFLIPTFPTTSTSAALTKKSSMWNLRKRRQTFFYPPVGHRHPSHHPSPSHGEKTVLSTGVTWHWGVGGKAMALWCRGAGKAPALVCWSQEIHRRRDRTNPGLRSQKTNQKPPSHPCNPQRGSLPLSTLHIPR